MNAARQKRGPLSRLLAAWKAWVSVLVPRPLLATPTVLLWMWSQKAWYHLVGSPGSRARPGHAFGTSEADAGMRTRMPQAEPPSDAKQRVSHISPSLHASDGRSPSAPCAPPDSLGADLTEPLRCDVSSGSKIALSLGLLAPSQRTVPPATQPREMDLPCFRTRYLFCRMTSSA